MLRNFEEPLGRRHATIFYSKFLADHPGDRAVSGAAEEDRGVNEQQQERIFIAAARAGKAVAVAGMLDSNHDEFDREH